MAIKRFRSVNRRVLTLLFVKDCTVMGRHVAKLRKRAQGRQISVGFTRQTSTRNLHGYMTTHQRVSNVPMPLTPRTTVLNLFLLPPPQPFIHIHLHEWPVA